VHLGRIEQRGRCLLDTAAIDKSHVEPFRESVSLPHRQPIGEPFDLAQRFPFREPERLAQHLPFNESVRLPHQIAIVGELPERFARRR